MNEMRENFSLKKYLDEVVQDKLKIFQEFIQWTDKDKQDFKTLLDNLEKGSDKDDQTTKEKGDHLENLVEFIIKKSYFFEIFRNVHTETNEIDEVIIFSDRGYQALQEFNLSRDLIPIDNDIFLGECKNYASNLGVTYVGKFYSLMSVVGIPFGIIFTQKGLTGMSNGYKDAYGLTKVLRMIENNKQPPNNLFILTFTMEDYNKMSEGTTFFDLIRAKKNELQLASDYHKFLKDNKHDAEDEIKQIISTIK